MSEPVTEDGSSSHFSQEDNLVFKDEEEDDDIKDEPSEEQTNDSPMADESIVSDFRLQICPDNRGYFDIGASIDFEESQR